MEFKSIGAGHMELNLANLEAQEFRLDAAESNIIINSGKFATASISIDVGSIILQTTENAFVKFETNTKVRANNIILDFL